MDAQDSEGTVEDVAARLTLLTGRMWSAADRERLERWLTDDSNMDVGLSWLASVRSDRSEDAEQMASGLQLQRVLGGASGSKSGFIPPRWDRTIGTYALPRELITLSAALGPTLCEAPVGLARDHIAST